MKYKSKYIFESNFIKQEKEDYKTYMLQNRFAKDTIRSYTNYVAYFLNFLEQQNLSPNHTTYNHIIEFIDYCREDGKSNHHINRILVSIRHYYKYLSQLEDINNPAAGIYIHGITRSIPNNLLEHEEIEEIYNNYKVYDNGTHRNKTILGLLLYQAVTTEELHKLGPGHINLQEGKIFIPGGKRTNSRTLKLEPQQILELHRYINETRPKIVNQVYHHRPGRKPNQIKNPDKTRQLFISINGSGDIRNNMSHLMKTLQKTNPKIQSCKQIRMSVITHWLKTKDVRQVQYMAGHRYVSSTEKYKQYDLKDLQEQLKKYHPLG